MSPATIDRNLGVDARGGALMIAELARRHVERDGSWGRIVGLTSGGPSGFAEEVSYGAAKAALENYTMAAATELARFGITANILYPPVTDTGWVTDEVRSIVAASADHVHGPSPGPVASTTHRQRRDRRARLRCPPPMSCTSCRPPPSRVTATPLWTSPE